ncbi:MAG: hypothetical protein K5931_02155 [Lachnospiraceae bacterium]|nr:hypothetical protein [Lachnospiraceae bacterium]
MKKFKRFLAAFLIMSMIMPAFSLNIYAVDTDKEVKTQNDASQGSASEKEADKSESLSDRVDALSKEIDALSDKTGSLSAHYAEEDSQNKTEDEEVDQPRVSEEDLLDYQSMQEDENSDQPAIGYDQPFDETAAELYLEDDPFVEEDPLTEEAADKEEGSSDQDTKEQDQPKEEAPEDSSDPLSSLNRALKSKPVLAVLHLSEGAILRSEPSSSAEIAAKAAFGTTIYLNKAIYNEGLYWFYVTTYSENYVAKGYVEKDKFLCVDEEFLEWDSSLGGGESLESTDSNLSNIAKESVYSFPDIYRPKLLSLLEKHPYWVFIPQNTGVSFEDAVNGEFSDSKSWIYKTAPDEYKLKATAQSGWYVASRAALVYYMNPVNFIDEKHIFQFEQLGFNSSYHNEKGVQAILNNTFMAGSLDSERSYAQAFMEIGKAHSVSPYHLASRIRQEQGSAGTSPLISGTYSGYEGYYNYFNINATGSTSSAVILNGLKYAKEKGWDSRYKSLYGGAAFIAKNFIQKGQDTLFLQKFNVVGSSYYSRYTHQYMQNIMAPYTESVTTFNEYSGSGAINNAFVFKIPVYTDMTISDNPLSREEQAKIDALHDTAKLYAVINYDKKLSGVSLEGLDLPGGVSIAWQSPDTELKALDDQPIQYFRAVYKKGSGIENTVELPVHITEFSKFKIEDVTNSIEGLEYVKPVDVIQEGRDAILRAFTEIKGYSPSDLLNETGLSLKAEAKGTLKDKTSPVIVKNIEKEEGFSWLVSVGGEEGAVFTENTVGNVNLKLGFEKNEKWINTASKTLKVSYLDTAPILEKSSGEVNIWKKEGAPIGLLPQNNKKINSVNLLLDGEKSEYFEVTEAEGEWFLTLTEEGREKLKEANKKLTQKLSMEIATSDSKVTIKKFKALATVTKPSVRISSIKSSNLFYTAKSSGSEAELLISAPAKLESVKLNEEKKQAFTEAGKPYFDVIKTDPDTGLVTLSPVDITAENYRQIDKKSKLTLLMEGYYPIDYDISLSTEDKKPVIKAEKAVIYEGKDEALLRIAYDKELPDDITVKAEDEALTASFTEDKRGIRLIAKEDLKEGSKSFTLDSESFRAPLTLNASLTREKTPGLSLENNNIILNKALDPSIGPLTLPAYITGSDLEIKAYDFIGINSKSKELLDNAYLKLDKAEDAFTIALSPEGSELVKTGSYKFTVSAIIAGEGEEEIKTEPLRLSLKIIDKEGSSLLKLSQKGKINLLDRDKSFILYSPKLNKGLNAGSIESLSLEGEDKDLFEASLIEKGGRLSDGRLSEADTGLIELKAKSLAAIESSKAYTLTFNMLLDNGLNISKEVKVTPGQSPKKTYTETGSLTLVLDGSKRSFTVKSLGIGDNDTAIDKVWLNEDSNSSFFTYTPSSDNSDPHCFRGSLKVNDTIKKTGSYDLKFKISYKDQAVNVGPAILKIKVEVR